MLYEIVTIAVRPGAVGPAIGRIGDALPPSGDAGVLLGFWFTDIGPLNRLISLWAHEDEAALSRRRDSASAGSTPWVSAIGEFITEIRSEGFRLFPFLNDIRPGRYGRFYEYRSYLVEIDAIAKAIAGWKTVIDRRAKMSPLVAVMYSVTGPMHRYVQFWPYDSLDDRFEIRTRAVKEGAWPPKGGVDILTQQENCILLPAPFSPLH